MHRPAKRVGFLELADKLKYFAEDAAYGIQCSHSK
jgi:hypothetical protein